MVCWDEAERVDTKVSLKERAKPVQRDVMDDRDYLLSWRKWPGAGRYFEEAVERDPGTPGWKASC